ncbi:exodeoxyribonuclease III [Luteibacter sp. NPDC031894]|uniref:exodeoxyribonuclease III n=1 Tax=Luteibacter sp. NPDC031894 TaxID=3390572 RepID=UPI003CFCE7A8
MKIATYNVNGIRSRLPNLLEWLEREEPDIACLQELKAVDQGFPIGAINDAGYGALWAGQASWNGVAILAKGVDPVESRRGLPGDAKDTQSRYLEAVAHGVLVGCIYLPNGNPWPGPKFDYKLAWFERFLRHAQALLDSGQPVVLAGDYNVVPTDEDIYDPKHWRRDALLQPESRDAYARLLAQGWTDALRERHPGERIYTFWDYFRQHWPRDRGLRIDHLLLAPVLSSRLKDANVDRWVRDQPKASDHAPTWVELAEPATAKKAPAKKIPAKKTPVKKTAAKKAAAKKAPARKAARPGRRKDT